jgi:hypothetical protein
MIQYFCYGSNMSKQRMIDRGVVFYDMKSAKLENYELRFNKISKNQGAVANIVYMPGSIVEGILYSVEDISILDRYEGVKGGHYNRVLLNVDNVAAWTYICENPQYIQEGLKPKQEYLNLLLEGKEYLSDEYYQNIKNVL